jgi:hypothetical protein
LILVLVVVGNGVRERSGSVSVNGEEPNGVGVLLRGFSEYSKMKNKKDFS